MKKDLLTHFIFTLAFFTLATFLRGWFDLYYWPFWLGAIVGTFLPDVDYLVYIYYLKPEQPISQDATGLIEKKSFRKTWDLLANTRYEHRDLIFHTAYFQWIFIVFSFWMVTSSGSTFGMGIALAFLLHLIVDMAIDLFEKGGINNWFAKVNVSLNLKQQKWYLLANILLLVTFGFVF
jgi:hypothetical protein